MYINVWRVCIHPQCSVNESQREGEKEEKREKKNIAMRISGEQNSGKTTSNRTGRIMWINKARTKEECVV
jgi:hypothetical protein